MSKGYAMSNLALVLLEKICTNIKMKCLNTHCLMLPAAVVTMQVLH